MTSDTVIGRNHLLTCLMIEKTLDRFILATPMTMLYSSRALNTSSRHTSMSSIANAKRMCLCDDSSVPKMQQVSWYTLFLFHNPKQEQQGPGARHKLHRHHQHNVPKQTVSTCSTGDQDSERTHVHAHKYTCAQHQTTPILSLSAPPLPAPPTASLPSFLPCFP